MFPFASAGGRPPGFYQIDRSLRFNDDDSANLSRTGSGIAGATGLGRTWTFSVWAKRGNLSSLQSLAGTTEGVGSGDQTALLFDASNRLELYTYILGTGYAGRKVSTAVFRDPSAWYHIVAVMDTSNATAADRMRLYVNGVRITSFDTSSDPTLNRQTSFLVGSNASRLNRVGARGPDGASPVEYFDGYLAEVHFIDGTALDPTSFGEFDTNGVWRPINVTGQTYGTNGFYLSFADNTSTTTLGYDDAGSNDWTLNNFSVTAGAGNDSLEDTPTNNFCVFNKLNTATTGTLANGQLDCGASGVAVGGIGMSSSAWYWEITSTGGTTTCGMWNGSATSTTTVTTGTTKGFRFDADAGTFDWTSDGSSWTSIATGLTSGPYFVYVSTAAATTASLNAGQRASAYTQPTGYTAISTANFPTPDIADPGSYMNAVTYTGTGSSLAITGVGFQPDLVWIKSRSAATDHALYDSTRGVQNQLESNTTTDETTEATGLTAFGSDGFTVGALAQVNTSSATYVGWCWREGVTPGFDVVTYTGTGVARTISHNLGTVPKLIIVKARSTASTDQGWPVYHASNTAAPETDYLLLNSTAATADLDTVWNDTAPTTTVFSVGTNALVNALNDTYVAYLFAEVEGFSKIGSYTGNGSADGVFVWTGHRPRFLMLKAASAAGTFWVALDSARIPYNTSVNMIFLNVSNAADTTSGT